jgi:hypothetical protein
MIIIIYISAEDPEVLFSISPPRDCMSYSPGRIFHIAGVPGDHIDMHVIDGLARSALDVDPGVETVRFIFPGKDP